MLVKLSFTFYSSKLALGQVNQFLNTDTVHLLNNYWEEYGTNSSSHPYGLLSVLLAVKQSSNHTHHRVGLYKAASLFALDSAYNWSFPAQHNEKDWGATKTTSSPLSPYCRHVFTIVACGKHD